MIVSEYAPVAPETEEAYNARIALAEAIPRSKESQERDARLARFTSNGLSKSGLGRNCVCFLTEKKKCPFCCNIRWNEEREKQIPFRDHVTSWLNRKTGERVVVNQPYYGSAPATLVEIEKRSQEFAAQNGLIMRVSLEDSWHCPGLTVLVEYRKA